MKENCVIEQTQEIDMTINDIKHSPEVMAFASMFHYGCLGIEKTEADIRASVKRVIDSGYYLQALDVELIYASLVLELFNGRTPVHASVSYPLGNMDKKKKLRDLDLMIRIGVSQCAYCLNYRNILDHNWNDIEEEVKSALQVNQGVVALEWIIQATLLTDHEIIDVCKAIQNEGGKAIKLNTGFGWGTGIEEVAVIKRVFGDSLDIHPSGNIRTLAQVDEFLQYDVRVIHSMSVFEIVDEFIDRLKRDGRVQLK